MNNKRFTPYDLKGKDYWKVEYIRCNLGYCKEIGTIAVDSETVANEMASILSAQGYDEVVVKFHNKDIPF